MQSVIDAIEWILMLALIPATEFAAIRAIELVTK